MGLTPQFKWAERTDKVYLTVEVPDVTDTVVELTDEGHLSFKGLGGSEKKEYALEVQLFKGIKKDDSKWAASGRNLVFVLAKAEDGYWERLLPTGVKMNNCKADWDLWKDEDEEQTEADFGGMDFGGFGGQGGGGGPGGPGGMGGMGGMGGPGGGGMDMASMMANMGGAGGMGGMDMASMMGGMGGMGGGEEGEDSDDGEDDMPPLEEPEETAEEATK